MLRLVCLYLRLLDRCSNYNFLKESKMRTEHGILSCSLQKVSSSEIPEEANAGDSLILLFRLQGSIAYSHLCFYRILNFFILFFFF